MLMQWTSVSIGEKEQSSSVASAKTNVSTNKGIVRCRYLVRYKGCNVW